MAAQKENQGLVSKAEFFQRLIQNLQTSGTWEQSREVVSGVTWTC
jgi:hypothetical protein